MKRGIRKKLTFTLFIVVTVTFFIASICSFWYFFHTLKNQTIQSEAQKLQQAVSQLRYAQNEVETLAKQIIIDESFYSYLELDDGSDAFDRRVVSDRMRKKLMQYTNLNEYYYSILALTPNGQVYSSDQYQGGLDLTEDWYQEFKETHETGGYSKLHVIYEPQTSKKRDVISYILPYTRIQRKQKFHGELIVNMGFNKILEWAEVDDTLLNGYTLYDKNGNVILSGGTVTADYPLICQVENGGTAVLDNRNVLIKNADLNDEWIFVSEVSNRLVLKQLRMIIVIVTAAYAMGLVILFVVFYKYIKNFTKPIEELHQSALSVQKGDFGAYVDIHTNDELETLGGTFNQMLDSIKEYMDRLVENERTKRTMELDRLMLQINPHFIYNTLNTIVYMAGIEGNDDIIRYTNAFISLLQDTLRVEGDGPFVTLKFELGNIRNYLILLSYRYKDQFEAHFDIDEDAMDCAVPNVMLQPLVENAVFHGLIPRGDKGDLWLSIKRKEQDVKIRITDNGVGMSGDMLERLMNAEEENRGGMRKIGVANVKKRLQTIYSPPYGMGIRSREGEGTRITITIPYQTNPDFMENEIGNSETGSSI
ncbi:sensor histidine kinase [Diplocloster agilis]|uniref:Sensor histidine kinase n=1 Tax=Diplocloster agilis TaxID=2850323 RepID=A0A949K1W3_9FIRM|nr:sensor histidine kinase [Diplocloster agilis]MBU9738431.1 sensor histidine kinase [Diplocloster agilis]